MFIVMELINEVELKDKIYNSEFEDADILNYIKQMSIGLLIAHQNGITHRDIKSSNIMITDDGLIKIMDFGLAKIGKDIDDSTLDTTNGTIAYMSPEQANGETVDEKSDLWSFGVIIYEMISKEFPFRGNYDQAILYSIINEEPVENDKVNSSLFYNIIDRCLKKNSNDRFRSSAEILDEIKK